MKENYSNQSCLQSHASDFGVGVVIFDDIIRPQQAWARMALPNAETFRISGPEDLTNSIIWWSNLPEEFFLQNQTWSQFSWIKHDRYPLIRPDEALMEWGLAPTRPEFTHTPAQICEFLCNIFWRILVYSFRLIQNLESDATMREIFKGKNLFDDLNLLVSTPIESNQNYQNHAVNYPYFRIFQHESTVIHDQILVLRKPRLSYVRTMLNTLILELIHSDEFESEQPELASFLAELERIRRAGLISLTKVSVTNIDSIAKSSFEYWHEDIQEQCHNSIWVTLDELQFLMKFAEFTILSTQICKPGLTYISKFSASVVEQFNNKVFESSWTAGIIAEVLWNTLFQPHKLLVHSNQNPDFLNGIYLQSINKTMMLEAAELMINSGFNTLGYGFGHIIVNLAKQQYIDGVRCAMKVGLTPSMFEVSMHAFNEIQNESWHGSPSTLALARCQLTHNQKFAWTLDTLPLLKQAGQQRCMDGMNLLFQNIDGKGCLSTKKD